MRIIGHLNNFFNYQHLFFQLVSRDIKLKYRRSVLGYLWSVFNPLLTMLVMTIVFSRMFARGIENFAVYLLIGNLMFAFMAGATNRSLVSIFGNAAIIKKIYIPKYIFTLSSVTTEFVSMLFSLGALIIVMIATRTHFTWYFLLIVVPVVELYIFSIGVGLFLAQSAVFFRDIQYIWGVVITAWTYLTPIFYPVDLLPDRLGYIVMNFNPMYFYITLFRDLTLNGNMGSMINVWRGAVAAAIMLFIGLLAFSRNKNKFILYI